MSSTVFLVEGDTATQIKVTLTRADTGSVVNFSSGSASLTVRPRGSTTNSFSLSALDSGTNFENGIAVFPVLNNLVGATAGEYQGEINVIFSTGTNETVNELLDLTIRADFA